MGGRRHRQRQAMLVAGVQHQPEILYENLDGRQRRIVVVQHVRHAIAEHPGIAGAGRDHLVDGAGVGARFGGERHRFGCSGDVHAGQKLVHRLHKGADAGRVAQAKHLGRGCGQDRSGRSEGLCGTRGHEGELARLGAGAAARHRRVEQLVA